MRSTYLSIILFFLLSFPLNAATIDDYYLSKFGEGGKEVQKAQSSLSSEPSFEKCYTPVLKGLKRDWNELQPSTQKVLAKYLARPALSSEATALSPSGKFKIHYATSGSDAPAALDSDSNGVPDWVEKVANVFDAVYQREVVEMGYKAPPTSGGAPFDVYLQNIGSGANSYLGLTDTDAIYSGNSYTSFMTIDNDFSEFSTKYTAEEYLKVTAAHEFHHAIQFGYNYWFETWYAEATSTWMEDEVFDSINQLYDYLPQYLSNPRNPLDTAVSVSTGGGYGRWIFNRYLAETLGRDAIKQFWVEMGGTPGTGSDVPAVPLLETVIAASGSSLDKVMLGLGKRFVLGDWITHTDELSRIHPLTKESSISGITYPPNRYSLAFYDYSAGTISLAGKPTDVAALTKDDLHINVLLLCNNKTGENTPPADITPAPATVADALVKTDPALHSSGPTVVTNTPAEVTSSGGSSPACFIATAAYGSYLAPQVKILRDFRDRYLLKSALGKGFVNLYYKLSPPVAKFVENSAELKQLVRGCLAILIFIIKNPLITIIYIAGIMAALYNSRRRFSVRLKL